MLLKIHHYLVVSADLEWSSKYPACSCLNYKWKCNLATKHYICFEIGNEWLAEERYSAVYTQYCRVKLCLKEAESAQTIKGLGRRIMLLVGSQITAYGMFETPLCSNKKKKWIKKKTDFNKIIFLISYFSNKFYVGHWRGN